jgi:hypothetical protein
MRNKKYLTASNFNRKITERGKFDALSTHIYDRQGWHKANIEHLAGVSYPRLSKYTQQHIAGLTERTIGPRTAYDRL